MDADTVSNTIATDSLSRTDILDVSKLLTKRTSFTKNPDASRDWRESAKTC